MLIHLTFNDKIVVVCRFAPPLESLAADGAARVACKSSNARRNGGKIYIKTTSSYNVVNKQADVNGAKRKYNAAHQSELVMEMLAGLWTT